MKIGNNPEKISITYVFFRKIYSLRWFFMPLSLNLSRVFVYFFANAKSKNQSGLKTKAGRSNDDWYSRKFFTKTIDFNFINKKSIDYLRKIGIVFICLVVAHSSFGQDIEEVSKAKFLKVSGGLGFNQVFYNANGIENRRDPYFWLLNANVNFNILGIIQAPFSLSLSQQNRQFAQPQPFNRFGISPKYKSVTLHLGHRSLRFSNYTLAGNLFFGAGIEIKPKDSFVRVSAMYGRLTKPVARISSDGLVFASPAFKRLGYGVKVGLGRADHQVDFIVFRGFDVANSIPIIDDLTIRPEENVVFGVNTQQKLTKRLKFELEYAYSLLTRDRTLPETVINDFSFVNNLGGLFRANISSEFNSAVVSKLDYSLDRANFNLSYRRVAPGYRTLGSSFLNNDLEDISGGLSFQLLKDRLGLNSSGGVQRNNLNGQLTEQITRVIYSLGTNIKFSQQLNANINYSNFNSETSQQLIQTDITIDSLEFFQVTRNGSVNVNWTVGNSSVYINGGIQDARNNQQNNSTFYNLNSGLQTKLFEKVKTSFSFAYNQNQSETLQNTTVGPILTFNKNFFEEKLSSSLSFSLLQSYISGEASGQTFNIRYNAGYRIKQKHSFSLSAFWVDNERITETETTRFNELRASLNYNYRF